MQIGVPKRDVGASPDYELFEAYKKCYEPNAPQTSNPIKLCLTSSLKEKKESDLPDSNQRPKDSFQGFPTTVLRSTN
jgi:hypothetical protein